MRCKAELLLRGLSADLLFSADSEPEEDDDIVSASHNDPNALDIESRHHREHHSKYVVEPFLRPSTCQHIFFSRADLLGARQQPLGASSTAHHSELMVSVDQLDCC